jgi:hypothetical protein
MSTRLETRVVRLAGLTVITGLALVTAAGCRAAPTDPAAPPPLATATPSGVTTPTAAPQPADNNGGSDGNGGSDNNGGSSNNGGSDNNGGGNNGGGNNGGGAGNPPAPAQDCVTYRVDLLTLNYEAGIYEVDADIAVVARASGGPGGSTGDQVLGLVKRYTKHCYLGRHNTREDHNAYVFDYWLESSKYLTEIPDEEDGCSSYDPTNLTVEDMGSGYGWRVKDHDHVLHLFDNRADAYAGKQIASKYHEICFVGSQDDENSEVLSYFR